MSGQYFVISRGPLPPDQVVLLVEFTPTHVRCQPVDRNGAAVGAPIWIEGRPRGWRFSTATAAHDYIGMRRRDFAGVIFTRDVNQPTVRR